MKVSTKLEEAYKSLKEAHTIHTKLVNDQVHTKAMHEGKIYVPNLAWMIDFGIMLGKVQEMIRYSQYFEKEAEALGLKVDI